jgi:ATP synthase protein I
MPYSSQDYNHDDMPQIATSSALQPMFRAILLQVGATAIAALSAGLFVGMRGLLSALLGGAACTLPNFLFALRLKRVANRPGASYTANFFLGEFVKIAATIALLVFVVKEYADLHWPSMLIGLVLALQAGFLAFWKKS